MAYLGQRDIREFIRLCDNDPTALRKLRTFYKGVFVTVPGRSNAQKIEDIVPHAGEQTFTKGDEGVTSVEVRHVVRSMSRILTIQLCYRRISVIITG